MMTTNHPSCVVHLYGGPFDGGQAAVFPNTHAIQIQPTAGLEYQFSPELTKSSGRITFIWSQLKYHNHQ